MIRQKLNRMGKIGILIFAMTLTFWNCQKDEQHSTPQTVDTNKSFKPISIDEVLELNSSSKREFGFKSKKQVFEQLKAKKFSKETSPVMLELADSKGLEHRVDNRTYYIFLMKRLDAKENYFYNLVVIKHNEETKRFIYKYPFDLDEPTIVTPLDGEVSFHKENQSITGKVPTDIIETYDGVCTKTTRYDITVCPCVGHWDPDVCQCDIKPVWEYISGPYYTCFDINDYLLVDGNGGNNSDPDLSNPISISDQFGCFRNSQGETECLAPDENTDAETPQDPLPVLEPDFEDYSITTTLDLTNLQRDWLDQLNNTVFKSLIEDYLNQFALLFPEFNNAKIFAMQAIDSRMANPSSIVDFEDKIINELTGKPLCVYNKLKELNGNLFKKTIGTFIDDPKYHLNFKVGNCATTDDACTNASNIDSTGEIVITIEDINQSGLGLATLILHEGIHAEIHRFVKRFQSGVDPNNRPRLFQFYAFYKGWAENTQDENYNWTNDAQHQYMVENYVKRIASAVRELDNNKYPLSHYMAYGWDGLTKYGYTSKRLSIAENSQNQNLRAIANGASQICN